MKKNLYQTIDDIFETCLTENKKEIHERNVLEVRNYYNALMYLNEKSENNLVCICRIQSYTCFISA